MVYFIFRWWMSRSLPSRGPLGNQHSLSRRHVCSGLRRVAFRRAHWCLLRSFHPGHQRAADCFKRHRLKWSSGQHQQEALCASCGVLRALHDVEVFAWSVAYHWERGCRVAAIVPQDRERDDQEADRADSKEHRNPPRGGGLLQEATWRQVHVMQERQGQDCDERDVGAS